MLVAEQTPMMSDDDQSRARPRPLVSHETLEIITRVAREAAGAAAEAAVSKTFEQLGLPISLPLPLKAEDRPEAQPKGPPVRRITDWNTYPGFRGNMLRREKKLLETNEPPLSKRAFAGMAESGLGDTERNILRMLHWYHLDPKRDWPPSTWPVEERPCPADCKVHRRLNIVHKVLILVGVGVGTSFSTREVLDFISDGRLDNVIKFCRHVAGNLTGF